MSNVTTREPKLPGVNQWCITYHQKMAPWSWDQGGKQASQIIIHISRIPQRGCACRYNSGD
jgi:hypothetical protein